MGIAELLWTQAWSGAPLYVLGMLAQGFWLHRRGTGFSLTPILATGAFSTALTILTGVVIWGRFFTGESIMLWQAVNLPALLASLVIYPAVGALVYAGFYTSD